MLLIAIAFAWAGPTVINRNISALQERVESLTDEEFGDVEEAIASHLSLVEMQFTGLRMNFLRVALPAELTHRTLSLFSLRASGPSRRWLSERYPEFASESTAEMEVQSAVADARRDPSHWSGLLALLKKQYPASYFMSSRLKPTGAAGTAILADAASFPLSLVKAAESALRGQPTRKVVPVVDVAHRDRWFED